MAEAVTTHVQTTANTGNVTYNMDHVFSATLDGWGDFAIQNAVKGCTVSTVVNGVNDTVETVLPVIT